MALFRLPQNLAPMDYKTYGIRFPPGTHTRPASCAEIECDAHSYGWVMLIDVSTPLGRRQAEYLRYASGRHFTETRAGDTLVSFTFPPGQQGFSPTHDHVVSLHRPPIATVRPGDHRVTPRRYDVYVHSRVEDWVDDFANNQLALTDEQQRG